MTPEFVLAIDQGTSATKALVVGSDGDVRALAEVPVRVVAGNDGSVIVDPDTLWSSLLEAGHEALRRGGVPVGAVALANQGETVIPWDRATGASGGPGLVWQDSRSASICDGMRTDNPSAAELLRSRTGLELDPYFVAPKIAWMRRQGVASEVISTSDAFLLHRLCGSFVTDLSTASRSLLLDLDRLEWSDELRSVFGLPDEVLPALVGSDQVVGETTLFSDSGSLPVVGLAVDQQAALFGEGCRSPGTVKCTYGTGAFLLGTIGTVPTRSTEGLVTCVAWNLLGDTTYCLDSQVFTVGAAVQWMQELGVMSSPSDLDNVGLAVPDAGGVVFVPAFAGHGTPFWRPDARGSISGLSLGTSRGHLVRALVDGVCAQIALLLEAMGRDLGSAGDRVLRVDGGLTRSRLLVQRQADLGQCRVEVFPSAHATALGVAEMAFRSFDPGHAGFEWEPTSVAEPSISSSEAEAVRARWLIAAEANLR